MKLRSLLLALAVAVPVLGIAVWQDSRSSAPAAPTVLSFRIGQNFEEVARDSTYPVKERSNIPTHAYLQSGETFVTEPAVILHFNDSKHRFTLPPTKFAMLGYMHNKVATVATSPMVEKLPFDKTVAVLEDLQNQFKAGGWVPWPGDDSQWFDLTPEGKKKLFARMRQSGRAESQTLRVIGKYSMIFRLWCADGCATGEPPYLFLIDVGVGDDFYEWWDEEHKKVGPEVNQRSRLPDSRDDQRPSATIGEIRTIASGIY
ncbi:MAG: hypothetical protein ABWY05_15510 [Noviherbaspirillum sp.]